MAAAQKSIEEEEAEGESTSVKADIFKEVQTQALTGKLLEIMV